MSHNIWECITTPTPFTLPPNLLTVLVGLGIAPPKPRAGSVPGFASSLSLNVSWQPTCSKHRVPLVQRPHTRQMLYSGMHMLPVTPLMEIAPRFWSYTLAAQFPVPWQHRVYIYVCARYSTSRNAPRPPPRVSPLLRVDIAWRIRTKTVGLYEH